MADLVTYPLRSDSMEFSVTTSDGITVKIPIGKVAMVQIDPALVGRNIVSAEIVDDESSASAGDIGGEVGATIAEIEARLRAATPGPWDTCRGTLVRVVAGDLAVPIFESVAPLDFYTKKRVTHSVLCRAYADEANNATFIANAPADVRTLLDLLTRLSAMLTNANGELERARVEVQKREHSLRASQTVAHRAAAVLEAVDPIRSLLLNVVRAVQDEGDRVYFGSTNDVDQLRDAAETLDETSMQDAIYPLRKAVAEAKHDTKSCESEISRLQSELAASEEARGKERAALTDAREIVLLMANQYSYGPAEALVERIDTALAPAKPVVGE